MLKRAFDIFFSSGALLVLGPLFFLIAIWVKLDSPGPVFFRQIRVGRSGVEFEILKFRSMHVRTGGSEPQITVGMDARISRAGHFLRQYKLDELPQFLNVFWGDMSVVGPRPEVPRYVALYPAQQRDLVLSVRPGITDLASIEYRDENKLLGASENPERTYVEVVMPAKLALCATYVTTRSFYGDLAIIGRSLQVAFLPRR
jgi:lipopolysaccharide/colanic/teichoic acid biosynthesis glycosyltransferase